MPSPYGLGYGLGAIGAGLAHGQLAATMMKPGLQHQQMQNQMLQQQMDEKQGLQLAAQNAIDPATGQLDYEKYHAEAAKVSPNFASNLNLRQAQIQKAGAQTEQVKAKTETMRVAQHESKAVRFARRLKFLPTAEDRRQAMADEAPELAKQLEGVSDEQLMNPAFVEQLENSTMKVAEQRKAEAREKEFALKKQGLEQKKLLDQSLIDYRGAKTIVDKQNAASNYLKALAMQTAAEKGQSPIDFNEGLTPEVIKTLTPLLKMKKSNSLLDPGERDMAGELLKLFGEVQASTTPIVPTKRGTAPAAKPKAVSAPSKYKDTPTDKYHSGPNGKTIHQHWDGKTWTEEII